MCSRGNALRHPASGQPLCHPGSKSAFCHSPSGHWAEILYHKNTCNALPHCSFLAKPGSNAVEPTPRLLQLGRGGSFILRLPDPVERLARDAVLSQKEAQLGRMFLDVAQGVQLELEKAHRLPPPPGESNLAVGLLV